MRHHYKEDDWKDFVAPYQIRLDNGSYIFASYDVDETIRLEPPPGTGNICGLCGRRDVKHMITECCGNMVCDTEDQYEMHSYQREGQCARNHRYHTICGYHHNESHPGSWKDCKTCENDFHPYDYAVKATAHELGGGFWQYNFDNNVRTDIDLRSIPLPQCSVCKKVVDTTEENTRTLSMRRMAGDSPSA